MDPPPLDDPDRPDDETERTEKTERPLRPDFDETFLTFGTLQTPFSDNFGKDVETKKRERDQRGPTDESTLGRDFKDLETFTVPKS